MAKPSDDSQAPALDAELNRLFQLPLDEFTGARNALAAQLKKSGRRDDAARIQATSKPSVSAWAVNHAWWTARETFQGMLDASEQLRDVQKSSLTGRPADLRGAVEAHQRAVRSVVDAAVDALGGPDRVSAQVSQRIASTCDAIASLAVPQGVVLGRLTDDLQPVGFAALSGFLSLVPATAGGTRAPSPPPAPAPTKRPPPPSVDRARPGAVVEDLASRRREQAQARERDARVLAAREAAAATGKALAAADEELAVATRRADDAVSARDAASIRVKEAEAALERARADHAAALRAIEDTRSAVAEKRRARDRAARAAAAAQQKLDRLT